MMMEFFKQHERLFGFSIVLVICNCRHAQTLPETIRIGGLFDHSDTVQEIAFRYAVDRVNSDRDIMPRSRLTAQIERIREQDSFYASKQVCKAFQSNTGLAAIFGPQSGTTSSHIQSICDTLEIPHIETRWDYRLIRDDYSVNLYPHPRALGQAFVSLIEAYKWSNFVVLYENSEGLVRLQEVLKMTTTKKDISINVRQLMPNPGGDYRPILKDIKASSETHIVLDCQALSIPEILKQAQQVGIMTAYHNWLITSLDLHMVELEEFKYGGTNISAYRLVDPDLEDVQNVVQDWILGELRYGRKIPFQGKTIKLNSTINPNAIGTETALIYDAVQVFARALTELDRSQDIQTSKLECNSDNTWQHGNSLINYMKLVQINGLTGPINFDARGFRTDFNLDIIELKQEGLVKVGEWNSTSGCNFTRNFTESYNVIVQSLHNKTLTITTIMTEPYTMLVKDSEQKTGNDRYEGYNMDLINEISKILGFNYTIRIVEDGNYGSYDKKTETWNGMIGELLAQKADLAVGDLTITYERESGVDFTMPFMNLGVTILYKKPTAKDPNLFSFLSPLSLAVWIYMVTAYLAVSLLLYVLARISPYEKGTFEKISNTKSDEKGSRLARPDPIYETIFSGNGRLMVRTIGTQAGASGRNIHFEEVDEDDSQTFTLLNSFWFMIASLLQQGTDLLPRIIFWFYCTKLTFNASAASKNRISNRVLIFLIYYPQTILRQDIDTAILRSISTRMVAGMWWFFTLIMISSYTANLAAFLTVTRMESPIESAEDLSKQHTIKYGTVKGGSTNAFFRDSQIPTYKKMWSFMDQDENNFVKSNKEGIDRVSKDNGNYAFLMESSSVEFIIERKCELTKVGGLLDTKGYGIALPPNSPFRTPISSAILQLQEGGQLHIIKEKWWKNKHGGGKCNKEEGGGEAAALGLMHVGGVFVVLLMGMSLACLVAFFEHYIEKRKRQRQPISKSGSSSGHLSSACTETTPDGTLPRLPPPTSEGRLIPYENGQVTQLDLAAHGPVGKYPSIPPNLVRDSTLDSGGFLTSSMSVAALNQSSCAVPMPPPCPVQGGSGTMNRNLRLQHSNSDGWASNSSGGHHGSRGHLCPSQQSIHYHQHRHEEQCPHYNEEFKYKEAPS